MNELVVLAAVAMTIVLIVLIELATAALPLVIVMTFVPPHERRELADVIAALDSRRRLRLWPALRLAVRARRRQR